MLMVVIPYFYYAFHRRPLERLAIRILCFLAFDEACVSDNWHVDFAEVVNSIL